MFLTSHLCFRNDAVATEKSIICGTPCSPNLSSWETPSFLWIPQWKRVCKALVYSGPCPSTAPTPNSREVLLAHTLEASVVYRSVYQRLSLNICQQAQDTLVSPFGINTSELSKYCYFTGTPHRRFAGVSSPQPRMRSTSLHSYKFKRNKKH